MTFISTSLEAKLQQAISHLPPSHRTPPQPNETFESLDAARLRLQDCAFTQGFALLTEKMIKNIAHLFLIIHGIIKIQETIESYQKKIVFGKIPRFLSTIANIV